MQGKGDFRWLVERLAPSKWRIVAGLTCVILAGIAATIDPLLMRTLIDGALPPRNLRNLNWALTLAGGIGFCYFIRALLSSRGSLINFSISQQCIRDLRIALLQQMNRLSEDYHQNTPTGEKLARMEHDVAEIANLGADTANQSIRAILFFILNLAMMVKLNFAMTLTILPLLLLFVFVQRRYRSRLRLRADEARVEIGMAASLLNEHLSAVPQIQFLGVEEATTQRAVSAWDGMLRAQQVQRRVQMDFSLSMSGILVLAIVGVLASGSFKVLTGALTIGGLVAFSTYVTRIFEPLSSAMDLYARLQSVGASIRRVREVLALEPSVRDLGTMTIAPDNLHCGFAIRDVSFSYGRDVVLRQLSLTIDAGEHVAIVGTSGSGKSTLARLLVRAADPATGSILLEGRSLSDYTLASLRGAVCYVPQHPALFQGTVRDNLLFANPDAGEEELDCALAAAQFTSIVEKLPQGLDTPLGPAAFSLSGGERQRLAIARALLRNSAALVLDESTSALDAPTEHAVLSSIASLSPGQTLVLISHRLSSLTWVDRFILLDKGEIAESGRHEELYAESPLYRSLYDASTENSPI
jgi:ABC-type multidrug transport system fused ATPase/permease subunit